MRPGTVNIVSATACGGRRHRAAPRIKRISFTGRPPSSARRRSRASRRFARTRASIPEDPDKVADAAIAGHEFCVSAVLRVNKPLMRRRLYKKVPPRERVPRSGGDRSIQNRRWVPDDSNVS